MANPIEGVVEGARTAVTAPIGWAKAKPVAFVILLIVVAGLTIRYRVKLAAWLGGNSLGRWLLGS